jgi:CRISPR-associated protein Csb2
VTTIGIRYLTGYAAATDLAAGRPEGPPHPGRVFMALAAAHFETGADPGERRALEWLESAPPPSVKASLAQFRSHVEAYVPVNDQSSLDAIVTRSRQPRTFAKARPDDECVFLTWDSDAPDEVLNSLRQLCGKVTRIGHSISLTQVWLADTRPEPSDADWHPGDGLGGPRLRVPSRGTVGALERDFNKDAIMEYDRLDQALKDATKPAAKRKVKAEIAARFPDGQPQPTRPRIASWKGYATRASADRVEDAIAGPFERDFIVLAKSDGPNLGLESTLQLTGALRCAAMRAAGPEPPEWLTGHAPDGSPSRDPHAAFFPLPFVGHQHADGHILGLGLAIPSRVAASRPDELAGRIGPLLFDADGAPRTIRLWRDGVWTWTLDRETRQRPPNSLNLDTWTRASLRWASVTPVVLHHHPKRREGDVERIAFDAVVSALLPEPVGLRVSPVSVHSGAGHIRSMPPYEDGPAGLSRYQVHMVVEFASPVRGPVLIGRGRFRGYGLFAPWRPPEARS